MFYETKSIATLIKNKYPHIPIVAGGPFPPVEPELTLQQIESLDSVCIGDGEEVSYDILEGIKTCVILMV